MRHARALLFGAFAGAVGLSALVTLLHALLAPELIREGLYVLFWWFFTLPSGVVLGGVSGAASAHSRQYGSREGGLIRTTGGGVVAFLFGLILLWCLRMLLHGGTERDWDAFVRIWLPPLGVPFVCALLMVSRGLTERAIALRRAGESAEED